MDSTLTGSTYIMHTLVLGTLGVPRVAIPRLPVSSAADRILGTLPYERDYPYFSEHNVLACKCEGPSVVLVDLYGTSRGRAVS